MHRIEETIARGMCIGCGACSVVSNGAVTVSLGPTRLYEAAIEGVPEPEIRAASRVCPFSDESPNEDDLGAPHGDRLMVKDPYLGVFSQTFAGRVADDDYVLGSSSGGLTTWFVSKLIAGGHVDAAISVGRRVDRESPMFEYATLRAADVALNRKSQYFATTMADVLAVIEETDQRYVLVGVPCFIRAARALSRENAAIRERLAFFVSLVCGHFKTMAYAESLAWQLGVPPDRLDMVDFRVKAAPRGANDYDFAARDSAGDIVRLPMPQLVGGNWGHNAFQPEACNFCDDVVGETADVSFGDAWLPDFMSDPRGTNIVITRSRIADAIFAAGKAEHELVVHEVSPADAVASQAGGFRHRRDGLSIRLADDVAAGLSVPAKRVPAQIPQGADARRLRLVRQRRRMAALSHELFAVAQASGDLDAYLRPFRREITLYQRIEHRLHRRVARRIRASLGAARHALRSSRTRRK